MWLEGYAGHTTPHKLWGFYGAALAAGLLGVPLWMAARGRERGGLAATAPRDGGRTIFLVAIACMLLYLLGPFSGAYAPAMNGNAPRLNLDNLRLAVPTFVAFAPLAAAGLSRLPLPSLIAGALGLLSLFLLRRMAGHVVPGMLVAALLMMMTHVLARRRWSLALRALGLLLVTGALALVVAKVDRGRERVFAAVWDGYARRIHNLSYADVQQVRRLADGRPIAVTGVDSWWGYYGRDFSGHPVYVPVGRPWSEAASAWEFHPDYRDQADRGRWAENLVRSGAAVVVVGSPGERCSVAYVESAWCRVGGAHFHPFISEWCDTAYEVRGFPGAAAERERP